LVFYQYVYTANWQTEQYSQRKTSHYTENEDKNRLMQAVLMDPVGGSL
jgi:hypothetical protein